MKNTNRTFEQALNLVQPQSIDANGVADRQKPFQTQSHSCGFKSGIDLDEHNHLVDELDAEVFVRKQAGRL